MIMFIEILKLTVVLASVMTIGSLIDFIFNLIKFKVICLESIMCMLVNLTIVVCSIATIYFIN